ncbi:MAG: hypothetical protein KF869_15335 [Phycisphaeraceae bacterium]|nr:hypothetical protein [Phycisphaeraceae bacterium]
MSDPLHFPDEGAAAPGSNGRTESDSGNDRLARIRLGPLAHHNSPPGTSDLAARSIGPHAAQQRADVLGVILKAGAFGATDAEIELITGIRAQSVSPRRGELRRLGLIVDSGRRRKTPRGRDAAVWVLAQFAPKPAPTSTPGVTGEVGP